MTTVFNLNILNFFGSAAEKPAEREVEPDAGHAGRREHPSRWQDRVIDVTSYARAADDSNDEQSRAVARHDPARGPRSAMSAALPPLVTRTYDRKGRMVPCSLPKGMNIDSYV